jgi:hypothetical protein
MKFTGSLEIFKIQDSKDFQKTWNWRSFDSESFQKPKNQRFFENFQKPETRGALLLRVLKTQNRWFFDSESFQKQKPRTRGPFDSESFQIPKTRSSLILKIFKILKPEAL